MVLHDDTAALVGRPLLEGMGMHLRKALLGFTLAALTAGCGTTATVSRRGAPDIEGHIVGADSESIYIETAGGHNDKLWSRFVAATKVPRYEVTDIDHPGNVAAVIGTVLTAYGVVNAAVGMPECDRQGFMFCAAVMAPVMTGLPLTIYGFVAWAGSRSAAEPGAGPPTPRVAVLPVASPQKKNEYLGATLSVTY